MRTTIWAVILVMLLTIFGLVYQLRNIFGQVAAAEVKAQVAQEGANRLMALREAEERVLAQRSRERSVQALQTGSARAAVRAAAASSPEWAEQVVPEGVQDALR